MADNKEKFRGWLEKRKKLEGGNYSKGTIDDYMGSLRRSHRRFSNEYGDYGSVFEINELGEFDRVFQDIKNNKTEYADFNSKKENGRFSAVMKLYRAFLAGEGEIPPNYRGEGGKRPEEQEGQGGKGGTKQVAGESGEPRNLIFFGAPGTGKSYLLNDRSGGLLGDDGESIRVTFHPDYSYAHFVGTYKPVPDDENNKEITYKYIPGPFMETYVAAKENPDRTYLLIIEEINRANVAAVFGDVFQLLDRKDGESEYPVKGSKDIRDYLVNDLHWDDKGIEYKEIKIPKNMYIWATMNSADQGVFPMDTAFKRRWDFEYLGIDTGADDNQGDVPIGKNGKLVSWNFVRKFINDRLAALGINEDKQLGAFFINAKIIANASDNGKGTEAFKNTFKNKVLMYLFEDAAKHKRPEMFDVKVMRYSEIYSDFDTKGMFVFKTYADPPEEGGSQGEGTEGTDSPATPAGPDGEHDQ